MALAQMKQILKRGSHVLLGLILVVLEKVVENDFVCPCRFDFTMSFFFLYLLGPTFVAFVLGIVLIRLNMGSGSSSGCCWNCISCTVPPAIWLAMFFSDGKYVACFNTELKEGYGDREERPWNPCFKNRTLTDDQRHSQLVFFTTKLAGLGILILLSVIALIYERCRKRSESDSEEEEVLQSGVPLQQRGGTLV